MREALIAILHADLKNGIGRNNDLMVKLPLDMKFFKENTINKVVAMGENTLLSFPNAKPLKDRVNIVLSQDPTHNYEGCVNVHTFEDFLAAIKKYRETTTVYIIGGASIYRQMLPYVDLVQLTRVHEALDADVFFPDIDNDPNFEMVMESKPQEDNGHIITFCVYKNNNPQEII